MRRLAAAGLVAIPLGCAALAGCSSAGGTDDLQVVQNPVAVTPVGSPVPSAQPAGTVLAQPSAVTALAVDPAADVLAVALLNPPSVRLYELGNLSAVSRSVPLSGPVEGLTPVGGQLLASIPVSGQLARIGVPGGEVAGFPVAGQPVAARALGEQTVVAVRDRKVVEVFGRGTVSKTITGELYSADDVLVAGEATVVLDRLRTALFTIDVAGGKVSEGLRAGDGAANAVADSFGRVLVTDARAGALLAFSTDPLLLRQRYPVAGGVYGIAYDPRRGLAWVTLTERNEVVGFDIRGEEPAERYRFPTVRQPNSVTVDERTSRVIVGSATGEGTQVIQP